MVVERTGYRSLLIWRRCRALAINVYEVTGRDALRKEWGMRDQMRRAALSAPSNIAEGYSRGLGRDCARFYVIARGSLAELSAQADIASAIGLLDPGTASIWERECEVLRSMLTRLINAQRT